MLRKVLRLFNNARFVERLLGFEYGFFLGSRTASNRRNTQIGKMTSAYLPRLNRSHRTSSAIPQINETIFLCVTWSIFGMQFIETPGEREALFRGGRPLMQRQFVY